jgi:hypothetical protein
MDRRTLWIIVGSIAAIIGGTYGFITAPDRYTIVVHNASPHELKNFRIYGSGCDEHLDPILPDDTIRHTFVIPKDGKLLLTGEGETVNGPTHYDRVIDDRVEKNHEGMTTVTVDQDGDLSAITEKGD